MSSFSRVLVRSPNWLGDAVMALPAIDAVRRHFASSALAVAAPKALVPVFESRGDVNVIPLESGGFSGLRLWLDDARAVAAGRFDLAILFPNSFNSALMVRRARIPERWGYRSDMRGWLLTRAVPRSGERSRVRHQAERYQDLVRALGIEPGPLEPGLAVPPEWRLKAREVLDRHGCDSAATIVGIAPGAAYGHAKRWPPDRFAALIPRLVDAADATCVLVGTPSDRDAGRAIESWPGLVVGTRGRLPASRVINVIGQTDLSLLIGLLSHCRAFVSNDSGAMHLAAAIGVPVTAIFGPTDERVTAPVGRHQMLIHPVWCRPCMLPECPIDHRCMTGISVAQVFDAASRQLATAAAGSRVG